MAHSKLYDLLDQSASPGSNARAFCISTLLEVAGKAELTARMHWGNRATYGRMMSTATYLTSAARVLQGPRNLSGQQKAKIRDILAEKAPQYLAKLNGGQLRMEDSHNA